MWVPLLFHPGYRVERDELQEDSSLSQRLCKAAEWQQWWQRYKSIASVLSYDYSLSCRCSMLVKKSRYILTKVSLSCPTLMLLNISQRWLGWFLARVVFLKCLSFPLLCRAHCCVESPFSVKSCRKYTRNPDPFGLMSLLYRGAKAKELMKWGWGRP